MLVTSLSGAVVVSEVVCGVIPVAAESSAGAPLGEVMPEVALWLVASPMLGESEPSTSC